MKIYDISQEVFSCNVYPGDPVPENCDAVIMVEDIVKNDDSTITIHGYHYAIMFYHLAIFMFYTISRAACNTILLCLRFGPYSSPATRVLGERWQIPKSHLLR